MKTKIKNEITGVKNEIRNRTIGYILTAMGLVAGLAWNDAIKSTIEYFFPANKSTIWAKLSYAVIVTLVVVFIAVYLNRLINKDDEKNNKNGKNGQSAE